MLIEVLPEKETLLGSALTPDEQRTLDCMRATGGITPDVAQKFGIINLAQTVKRLRALGYDVRELTNDPRIDPREYAFTVYTLYDEVEHIQAVINRLSGLCLSDSLLGHSKEQ